MCRECAAAKRMYRCPLCGAFCAAEQLREGLPALKGSAAMVSECKLRALLQQVTPLSCPCGLLPLIHARVDRWCQMLDEMVSFHACS